MVIPESIIIGLNLDSKSLNLSSFSEALICNSQCNGQGHHNKNIDFTHDDVVFFIL